MAACGSADSDSPATTGPADTPTTPATLAAEVENPSQVVIEEDVPFATFGEITLTLDLYMPADPSSAPIVVEAPADLAHDGAIVVTNVTALLPDPPGNDVSKWLGEHGLFLRRRAEAAACAIRFALGRAAELGNADPTVVVFGASEGGGAAAHVALFGATLEQRWDEFAQTGGPPRQMECLVTDGTTHVDGLVGTAGGYGLWVPITDDEYGRTYQQERDPELQQFLASALGANPDLTIRLAHGTNDMVVPVSVSTLFEAALAAAGYDVELITYEGGHEDPPDEILSDLFSEFLEP